MHRVIAPEVRIEQTRWRLARLRAEGLVDRITLPQAGRTRAWFPTPYGVQLASEWPEMRGRRPSRTVSDPTAARLKAGPTVAFAGSCQLGGGRRVLGLDGANGAVGRCCGQSAAGTPVILFQIVKRMVISAR